MAELILNKAAWNKGVRLVSSRASIEAPCAIRSSIVFASPFYLLWMAPDTPWYVPYIIWLAVIVMAGAVQLWRGRHEL